MAGIEIRGFEELRRNTEHICKDVLDRAIQAAEIDISAQEAEKEKAERERKELFDQIRAALVGAKTIAQLQTAWSLTNGKKTRLDEEFHTQLLAIKDSRKAELLEVA